MKFYFKIFILLFLFFIFPLNIFSQDANNNLKQEQSVSQESDITLDTPESEVALNFDNNETQFEPVSSVSGFWIFIRMIFVLIIIVGIIYFIFRLIKKSAEPGKDEDPFLRKVSSITLSPGKSVQVVTLLDKAYILGVGDDSINLIDQVNDLELINAMNLYADKSSENIKPKNFQEILNLFMPNGNTSNQKSESKKSGFSFFQKPKSKELDSETLDLLNSLKEKRLKE
jgi:flagellar protein FliO/FliZ